jgi:hypothetical protein
VKNRMLALVLTLVLSRQLSAAETGFTAVQLLDGYSAKRDAAIDAVAWTIQGRNSLIIHFESGPSEGCAVDDRNKEKYEWYLAQRVNGRRVLVALRKPDLKTDADLEGERKSTSRQPGLVFLTGLRANRKTYSYLSS